MSENPEITAYRFNGFTLDFARESLQGPRGEIHLRPQAFFLLRILADHAGELVCRDTLMDRIWGPTVVTEASITQCLAELRRALDDHSHELIRTIPRRGYILDCPLVPVLSASSRKRRSLRRLSPVLAAAAGILLLGNALVMRNHSATLNAHPEATSSQSTKQASEARAHLERGQLLYGRRQAGDLADALEAFQQAVELDPGLAEAWAGISAVYFLGLFYPDAPSGDVASLVEPAERALALAPDNGMVLTRAARAALVSGDRQTARQRMRHAAEVAPDDPLVLAETAGLEFSNGNYAEAFRLQRRATQLQPLSAAEQGNLGTYALSAGEFRASIAAFQQAEQLAPEVASHFSLHQALALIGVGDTASALKLLRKHENQVNRLAIQLIDPNGHARANHLVANEIDNVSMLQRAMLAGSFYALRGELELARMSLKTAGEALDRSEAANNDAWPVVPDLLSLPWWEPLRQDESFIAVCERIGRLERQAFYQRIALAGADDKPVKIAGGKS